nr:MAG TPA: hypothetical protein [Caudoviricetes sp.]
MPSELIFTSRKPSLLSQFILRLRFKEPFYSSEP